MALANRIVRAVLGSPLHRMMSGSTVVIRYVGRRSGATFSTPTQYAAVGGSLVILVGHPETKNWWRNFREPHALDILQAGSWISMTGTAHVGAEDPGTTADLLASYLARFPRAARSLPDDPAARLRGAVLVECRPV